MGCATLLLAAGSGTRFGPDAPKVLTRLQGRPVLLWSLDAMIAAASVDHIVIMVSEQTMDAVVDLVEGVETDKILDIVLGGAQRQDTVRLGLEHLSGDEAPARVLIHDAARPGLLPGDIDAMAARLEAVDDGSSQPPRGLSAAIPAADTLVRYTRPDAPLDPVDRSGLYRMQTPQGFAFTAILDAHQRKQETAFTCDATLYQAAGGRVELISLPRAERLMKLTFQSDANSLEGLLGLAAAAPAPAPAAPAMETRTGFGFDVHAFGEAREDGELVLAGVTFPGERPLKGHSDADVALHALTDAIYGGLAEGDIGHHFPPSDPQWKGADSTVFLEHALGLIRATGGRLVHLDLTLICERPKIGPRRDDLRARLSALTGLEPGRISVKATTTEGLGFTGRGEGIAAQATVTLQLPTAP